jgi:tRNA(Ile)-lysidine synthase
VLAYLEERGLPFRTDSTNTCDRFLRNRIRNRLIPRLDLLFPHWRTGILGLAETQALTAAFIGAEARRRLPWSPEEAAGPAALGIPGGNFFREPEILREEALFQAAGLLRRERPGSGGLEPDEGGGRAAGTLRRGTLRLFARGGLAALDAGPLRLENRGERVSIRPAERQGEEGFCLLLKAPGRYKLKGFTLEAGEYRAGEGGFFARLPLVVRQNFYDDFIILKGRKISGSEALDKELRWGYTDIMTAADAEGTAAFIGLGRNGPEILLSREKEKSQGNGFFFYLTGG